MRALDVATFGYAKNLPPNQWPAFSVGFVRHSSWKQQLKNSSNNENTVESTAFWLSVWKKCCLEQAIAKEIENYQPTQLNTLLELLYAEIIKKHGSQRFNSLIRLNITYLNDNLDSLSFGFIWWRATKFPQKSNKLSQSRWLVLTQNKNHW